jgi:hypothetical protein
MKNDPINIGDLVMLQPKIKKIGKQPFQFSTVVEIHSGAAILKHPLNDTRIWEYDELRVVDPAKIWNKAYRKGMVAGKNLKTKKQKAKD